MTIDRIYTQEFKDMVVARLINGERALVVGAELNVPTATMVYWKQKATRDMSPSRYKTRAKGKDLFKPLEPVTLDPQMQQLCDNFVDEIKTLLLKQVFNNIR